VIGAGAWGTALAVVADRAGRRTALWAREERVLAAIAVDRRNPFLPGHTLPDTVRATGDLADAVAGADLVALVIPAQHMRAMVRRIEAVLAPGVPVVVCSKGIETTTGALMSAVVAAEMPGRPHAVLSGPSFADEVAAGQPTAVTVAADAAARGGAGRHGLSARVAVSFTTAAFRPYVSDDPIGVEVGGAVKNVLAIACGIASGLGFGSNPRAALIARGLAEMKRLAEALGGQRETVSGLSGLGDLTLTCSSEQSRNFSFGRALGLGLDAAEALAGTDAVVEGATSARAVAALARSLSIEMPICETVDQILYEGLGIDEALRALLTRPITAEPRALEPLVQLPHPAADDESDLAAAPGSAA